MTKHNNNHLVGFGTQFKNVLEGFDTQFIRNIKNNVYKISLKISKKVKLGSTGIWYTINSKSNWDLIHTINGRCYTKLLGVNTQKIDFLLGDDTQIGNISSCFYKLKSLANINKLIYKIINNKQLHVVETFNKRNYEF